MKIKLPRRPKGLRFPFGIPRVPATGAERPRSAPLAVLGAPLPALGYKREYLDKWTPLVEPQIVKERCIGCNAKVKVETDGAARRYAAHSIGNHRGVPLCSASGDQIPPSGPLLLRWKVADNWNGLWEVYRHDGRESWYVGAAEAEVDAWVILEADRTAWLSRPGVSELRGPQTYAQPGIWS
jgi:hypothetical protein